MTYFNLDLYDVIKLCECVCVRQRVEECAPLRVS